MSRNQIIKIIEDLACNSEYLHQISRAGKLECAHFFPRTRVLQKKEIKLLKKMGNKAEDWAAIRVSPDFEPRFIENNLFLGNCFIHKTGEMTHQIAPGVSLPGGIYGSTVADSLILSGVLVKNVGLLSNYLVGKGSVLLNTGEISAEKRNRFGADLSLVLGDETGSRKIAVYPEISLAVARALCLAKKDPNLFHQYQELVNLYVQKAVSSRGIIGHFCVVKNNPFIRNSFLGDFITIDGGNCVENSTFLGSEEEPVFLRGGNFIRNSILQWGSSLEDHCSLEGSIMTEHSHARRHGKIISSLIGPNTEIAEGEVTSSLVGPFVGFHHQSLLIGAIWPEGKGNVAYGANVGSNHTAKAPDQEIWCGEGTFFGLGVNVKFPADFTRAPYSILSSGIITLPQKMEFPFSLINTSSRGGLPPGYNELIPGWVLSHNLYLLFRNEVKYKARNTARRNDIEFSVFRPDIVALVLDAREKLKQVEVEKELYLPGEIPGMGKNWLSGENRRRAIEAYDFFIHYFLLSGLVEQLEKTGPENVPDRESFFVDQSTNPLWEYRKELFDGEGWKDESLPSLLEKYDQLLKTLEWRLFESKRRDDRRGPLIIDDYREVHLSAEEDPFLLARREEIKQKRKGLKGMISHWQREKADTAISGGMG